MFPNVAVQEIIIAGVETVIDAVSATRGIGVVFEDDGDTGYFYAVDLASGAPKILDATLIYRVQAIVDRHAPVTVKIVWSAEGAAAALLINDVTHAAFDFDAQKGYCRQEYPAPSSGWTRLPWEEKLDALFASPATRA